jgi:hypothetical protein
MLVSLEGSLDLQEACESVNFFLLNSIAENGLLGCSPVLLVFSSLLALVDSVR